MDKNIVLLFWAQQGLTLLHISIHNEEHGYVVL